MWNRVAGRKYDVLESSIIDWMKRMTSLESNNSGIITLKEGNEISYNG
jgi:hypothetical protein